ncbi:MAG: FtsK/SpoIIIE domain-containing protein [Pseudolysinimonas sp.]
MRLKLTLTRDSGSRDDIVVTTDAAATIGEIAGVIRRVDPRHGAGIAAGSLTLRATLPGSGESVMLPPEAAVGEAWIGSGATVSIADAGVYFSPTEIGKRPTVATVRALSGSDAGTTWNLPSGSTVIGRDASCDIVLADGLVSKKHLRLDIDSGVELVDLGSANGVVVDGGNVQRLRVDGRVVALVGDTELEIVVTPGAVADVAPTAGPIFFNRSPKVEPRYAGQKFVGPEVPSDVDTQPFPFLAMVAPILMGGVLFAVNHQPTSLLFVALSPVLMVGNFITQRTGRVRKHKDAVKRFDARLSGLTTELDAERGLEVGARTRESPSTAEVIDASVRRGPLLWTRRPEHWSFLNVRLGVGRMRSRNEIDATKSATALPDFQERFDSVVQANTHVEGVPVVDNLHESGALGVAGPTLEAAEAANGLLVQLTGLHSPAELVVAALVTPAWTNSFDWLKWMPHTSSSQSPLEGSHLADSATSGAQLLSAIEELVTQRVAARAARRGATNEGGTALVRGANVGSGTATDAGTDAPIPAVVLLVTDDASVDRARLVQLAEQAADAGVYPIWVAPDVHSLPAVCRTYLEVGEGSGEGETASVGFVRVGETIEDVAVERVSAASALDFARRLAPVIDAGALAEDSSDLPRSVSLVTLLGHELVESSDAVIDRWQQNESIHDRTPGATPKKRRGGRLRAIVGSAGVDPLHLDLRTQGPHALVGGTTGAGKSEFLQAWVLGMAAEYSPDRVTFLFVDYKGGSAFADCVTLPHCVGLVTDLSPHLVRRALTSLRAELRYREHLLNRKKAKDLLELEKRGDPESPPALVLVIDEFAALAGEVPEFVDGVVDIAQRGRSLGIHLIMATQRPAGVIKDNLRANTNMRVALRMADESDSQDVVGVKDAGGFDPGLPGRGLAKTGPGRLSMFQSGYAGGWTSREPDREDIDVAELRFGGEIRWEAPSTGEVEEERDLGPTDQQRLVSMMIAASGVARIPAPRRPWLDELASAYDLGKLRQRTDSELLLGVADIAEQQQQLPVYFSPDVDGNIAIYGTGGSGKSTALRTLAAAAAVTPRGGPVQVYGLDFGSGSLRMLETLPHVGAVIAGDDAERVIRLFRMLKQELEARGPAFAEANAASVSDYRRLANAPQTPRILLLIDGFSNFRDDFEIPAGRSIWYDVFKDMLSSGRQLGMHVALTADRAGAVPASINSTIQRRVVLRLAEDGYGMLDVPSDILSSKSPAGRAIIDGAETQIAVLGGSSSVSEQSDALEKLGEAMRRNGIAEAPAIGSLPKEYPATELPATVDKKPALGIGDADLGPLGFDPTGTMLIAGPPASGRTNALMWVADAIRRAEPKTRLYYFGTSRSPLASQKWTDSALTPDAIAALARELTATVSDDSTVGRIAIVIESIGDYLQSAADGPIVELSKAVRRSDHFLVAEGEMSAWGSSWPLMGEIKNGRRGLLLQPETVDGDILLKTTLPRISRAEFPPGRGMYIAKGASNRVQLPLVLDQ